MATPFFKSLKSKSLEAPLIAHTPPLGNEILLLLSSKYIQKLIISHHLFWAAIISHLDYFKLPNTSPCTPKFSLYTTVRFIFLKLKSGVSTVFKCCSGSRFPLETWLTPLLPSSICSKITSQWGLPCPCYWNCNQSPPNQKKVCVLGGYLALVNSSHPAKTTEKNTGITKVFAWENGIRD